MKLIQILVAFFVTCMIVGLSGGLLLASWSDVMAWSINDGAT